MKKILSALSLFLTATTSHAAEIRPDSFADLSEKLLPIVVNISTLGTPGEDEIISEFSPPLPFLNNGNGNVSLGSGFFIDEQGTIITNRHVIAGAEKIQVTTADDVTYEAKLIGSDDRTDLALIAIEDNKPFPFAVLGDSDASRIGEWILAIGNPFGLGGSVTAGIISAKARDIESGPYDNFIQTDASINQGNSGGPMFNIKGEVIGINSAIYSTSGGSVGVGFAQPINSAKFVIAQLKEKGIVERGWIGLSVQPRREKSGINETGILVSGVSENSPAAAAGLEAGDILISLNNKKITQARDFSRQIAETTPGKIIQIDFLRNGDKVSTEIRTAKMPPSVLKSDNHSVATDKKEGFLLEELELRIIDVTPQTIIDYKLPAEIKGVIITEAAEGSDASLKGIKSGDVIQQIDKNEVLTVQDVVTQIQEAKRENRRPVLLLIQADGLPNFVALKFKGEVNDAR